VPPAAWESLVVTGKARAAIRQVAIAQATADYAKAVLGSQITAEYDLTDRTVSDNLSQIRGTVSAQATQIASVEATADKALAVLGSEITAEYDLNGKTVSDGLSQVNAAISAQASQISSVEADAEKALAVLGSSIVADYDNNNITVSATLGALSDWKGSIVGSYKVSIDANGYLAGFESITGTGSTGALVNEFRVRTDKFLIGPPSTNPDVPAEYFFSILTRGGQAKVSIKGDLIADGTIAAPALAVSQLSAITGNVGDLTAGVVRSSNNRLRIELDNARIVISDS